MEDDTWQPGTVARVQVEHEGGVAPFAVQLDRGDAVIAPADEERFIRPLGGLRFRVGDRVECHVEDDRWAAGTVERAARTLAMFLIWPFFYRGWMGCGLGVFGFF